MEPGSGSWRSRLGPVGGRVAGGIGLQDLLRLHADVVVLEQAAIHVDGGLERAISWTCCWLGCTGMIDAVVAQMGQV